jgi:hypothetical protein
MNPTLSMTKPEPFLSKRRLTVAGMAALAGCAAACSLPLLLVAAGGSAAATTIASLLGAGTELVAGGLVFAAALGIMAFRGRSKANPSKAPTDDIPIACDPRVFSQEERVTHAARAQDLLVLIG